MWILCAFGSALFAGITAILAKTGIQNTNSHLATALRTVVVLLFAWLMAFVVSGDHLGAMLMAISGQSLLFLILSGITTGASWLFYFRALQLGEAYKVAAIDKASTIFTMVLAFILLSEPLTANMAVGMLAMAAGTLLMVQRPKEFSGSGKTEKGRSWILYALLSALFASLTSILVKVGIQEVESNLGTAIRTAVVLLFAWSIVFGRGAHREIRQIDRRSWLFLILSGFATGLSWLLYYRALQEGPASIVVPIDKLSILATVLFARIFLKEKLTPRTLAGLALVTAGTLLLLVQF